MIHNEIGSCSECYWFSQPSQSSWKCKCPFKVDVFNSKLTFHGDTIACDGRITKDNLIELLKCREYKCDSE